MLNIVRSARSATSSPASARFTRASRTVSTSVPRYNTAAAVSREKTEGAAAETHDVTAMDSLLRVARTYPLHCLTGQVSDSSLPLLQVAGLRESSDVTKPTDVKLVEDDGLPSLAYAKRMLKWLAEGVGRGLELSVTSETPKDMLALLSLLLSMMGEGYIEVSLDAASETATSQESGKAEPDLVYLSAVRNAIGISNLMIMCVNTLLIPLAAGSITVRREMEKKTNLITVRIEEKVNTIEQKTIDATLIWVNKLLSGQRKNDFRPKEGDNAAWLEKLQTPVSQLP